MGGNTKVVKRYIAIFIVLSISTAMLVGSYSIALEYRAGTAGTSESELRNIYSSSFIKLRPGILCALAANSNTPPDILDALSKKEGSDRKKLTLKVIFSHDDRTMLRRVAENPNIAMPTLKEINNTKGFLFLENSMTPVDLLEKAMKVNDQYINREIAGHPNASDKILETLSYDDRSYVRIGVALNPNTPISILKRLAHDADQKVQSASLKGIEQKEVR